MNVTELLLMAVGLAMDAFAVSICKGLAVEKVSLGGQLTVGLWFGGFQAVMPCLGYLVGAAFETKIAAADHWIAFVLLGLIGLSMIRESRQPGEGENGSLSPSAMIPLAVATSIDAFAVGITLALLPGISLPMAALLIGGVAFVLSALGVGLGAMAGGACRKGAELLGGILLIALGAEILLDHLGLF